MRSSAASRYQALLLDLDGTLTDSAPGIAATVNAVLAEAGLSVVPTTTVYPLIGLPLATLFGHLASDRGKAIISHLVHSYRERYALECIPTSRLFPGVRETLAGVHAKGTRLALVTSKPVSTARAVLLTCGIESYFEVIIGGDAVQLGKPAPEMVQRALALLDVLPESVVIVGDSAHDVTMAGAAGVTAWGVTYGVATASELRTAGATHLIDHFPTVGVLLLDQR